MGFLTPHPGDMKISLNLTGRTILAIVALSMIGTAAAAITLFTHTFPSIPAAVVTTTCTTLTGTPTTVPPGSSGVIRFTCGTDPAFTSALAASASPMFSTLPTGYTGLSGILHGATTCAGPPNPYTLTSGSSATFSTAGATFDYCASFTNAPTTGLGTFTVTWEQ